MWKLGYVKQNYTLELFIALEMVYCCCFSLRGNLDFLDFLKKFYNINSWLSAESIKRTIQKTREMLFDEEEEKVPPLLF